MHKLSNISITAPFNGKEYSIMVNVLSIYDVLFFDLFILFVTIF